MWIVVAPQNPVDSDRLERIKSNLRYGFALGLDSPGNVASTILNYLVLTGDPESVNRTYEQSRFAGPVLLWGADIVYTFPGQGANEQCNFLVVDDEQEFSEMLSDI